jgi:DNA polymerase III epsilon subunit-like protein
MTIPPRQRDLCFIDVETTGTIFGYHEIIEVGAVRMSADLAICRGEMVFKLLPRYPERFTAEALRINGYSPDAWRDSVASPARKWEEFVSFGSGSTPVCHNPSFDRAFVTLGALEYGVSDLQMDYHWIGTESVGWPLYCAGRVKELSLNCFCEFLGMPAEPEPHSAMVGARTCLMVYRGLMNVFSRDSTRT